MYVRVLFGSLITGKLLDESQSDLGEAKDPHHAKLT